ncbi:MAG: PHP domain-containing protein [Burkholderiales bacterium]|nr:PHP domain-containing protein [Burkholderiales bacterium]
MTSILNADLHCHSVVSDGTLTPEELAARAAANGVELWALTDHDEIGGQHRAAAAARALGMKYLTGAEISITFAGQTVHIVGLGFDPDDTRMQQGLYQTRGIVDAGGQAVIAHPARYSFSANEEYALFSEFKAHGGQAVEVVTGSHTAAEYVKYADMAREFGLAASRGSDFHSPDESRTDLGALPYLPGGLTPVWELLAGRIQ